MRLAEPHLRDGRAPARLGPVAGPSYHALARDHAVGLAAQAAHAAGEDLMVVYGAVAYECDNRRYAGDPPAAPADFPPGERHETVARAVFAAQVRGIHERVRRWWTTPDELRAVVTTEYREAVGRLDARLPAAVSKGGRPRDGLVDRAVARCRELRAARVAWKEIPGIVNGELGTEYELSTLKRYLRPSRQRKTG